MNIRQFFARLFEKNEDASGNGATKNGSLLMKLTCIAVCIAVIVVCATVVNVTSKGKKVTNDFVMAKIENVSELVGAKMIYTGLASYEKGKIPLINKKSFSMIYRADIRAGIDINEVDVNVNKETIVIKLPKADVLDVKIVPESIKFYDEKYALFNWEDKEDTVAAVKAAEEDVRATIEVQELCERACEQSKMLIEALIFDAADGRTIIFE